MQKFTQKDNVNPDHYKNQCSLECIEVMRVAFGDEAVINFCICNSFKYAWRYKNKNGNEDLKKAQWYLSRAESLIEGAFIDVQQQTHFNELCDRCRILVTNEIINSFDDSDTE